MADTTMHHWTRADLQRIPEDGKRYEVLDGELLVTPSASSRHQTLATELGAELRAYCLKYQIGTVNVPGAVVWGGNELQPDVVVREGTRRENMELEWAALPTPLLVVEVESDSTKRHDRSSKRSAYIELLRIPEYWLVDPREESIHIFRVDGAGQRLEIGQVILWSPVAHVVPFELPLTDLFRPRV